MVNSLKVPLTQKELDHLARVIGDLEKKTSGEMRLMIVKSSSELSHLKHLVWFITLSIALLGLWVERHLLIWTADWWLIPAVLTGTYLVAHLLSCLPIVARALTANHILARQVLSRAELEFHREGLGSTSAQTGILLFISMLEHQAVVLADKGIHQKLGEDTWKDVVATLLEGPKSGHWVGPLERALNKCGALLATHFPVQDGDKNELPNHVIIRT